MRDFYKKKQNKTKNKETNKQTNKKKPMSLIQTESKMDSAESGIMCCLITI